MGRSNAIVLRQLIDNQYCTKPVQHDRTKHIEVDKHFIKEKLDNSLICTPFVSTKNQRADILTKELASTVFQHIISKLGMKGIHSPV